MKVFDSKYKMRVCWHFSKILHVFRCNMKKKKKKTASASHRYFEMEYFYYKTESCALKYKQISHSFIDDKYMKEHLGLWSYFIIHRQNIF